MTTPPKKIGQPQNKKNSKLHTHRPTQTILMTRLKSTWIKNYEKFIFQETSLALYCRVILSICICSSICLCDQIAKWKVEQSDGQQLSCNTVIGCNSLSRSNFDFNFFFFLKSHRRLRTRFGPIQRQNMNMHIIYFLVQNGHTILHKKMS